MKWNNREHIINNIKAKKLLIQNFLCTCVCSKNVYFNRVQSRVNLKVALHTCMYSDIHTYYSSKRGNYVQTSVLHYFRSENLFNRIIMWCKFNIIRYIRWRLFMEILWFMIHFYYQLPGVFIAGKLISLIYEVNTFLLFY